MSGSRERVLLADIGGTHVRFALADPDSPVPLLDDSIVQQPVAAHASLAEAASAYLGSSDVRVRRGVFAIAGPVHGDEVRMTNHPWRISCRQLRESLELDLLELINDFAAQAMALQLLRDDDLLAIGPLTAGTLRAPAIDSTSPEGAGSQPRTCVVLGPGTGLGVAAWLQRQGRSIALSTEAGHIAFAPGTPEEMAILERLSARHGRVSNERLLSGRGLVDLHRVMAEIAGDTIDGDLQPAQISAGATTGDPGCIRSVEMFCQLSGSVAGDMVLALGAWDGAYLSGGILPHLLPLLIQSGFRRRFQDKGRYSEAIARVPTMMVMHPQPGLLGAAAMSMRIPPTVSTGRHA